jgi:hypothetical protein
VTRVTVVEADGEDFLQPGEYLEVELVKTQWHVDSSVLRKQSLLIIDSKLPDDWRYQTMTAYHCCLKKHFIGSYLNNSISSLEV